MRWLECLRLASRASLLPFEDVLRVYFRSASAGGSVSARLSSEDGGPRRPSALKRIYVYLSETPAVDLAKAGGPQALLSDRLYMYRAEEQGLPLSPPDV